MQRRVFYSQTQPFVPGSLITFDRSFINPVDPITGGNIVVDYIDFQVSVVLTTTSSSVKGKDLANLGTVTLSSGASIPEYANIAGYQLRQFALVEMDDPPADPADVGTGANTVPRTMHLVCPLRMDKAARPKDFAKHGLLIQKFGTMTFSCAAAAAIPQGGSGNDLVIVSGNVVAVAFCHVEKRLELKTAFIVQAQQMQAENSWQIAVAEGQLIRFGAMNAPGSAGGGLSMVNDVSVVTDQNKNINGWSTLPVLMILEAYENDQPYPIATTNPVATGEMLPFAWPRKPSNTTEFRGTVSGQNVVLLATETLSEEPTALVQFLVPRDPQSTNRLLSAAGISNPQYLGRTKSGGATVESLGDWANYIPLLVKQAS